MKKCQSTEMQESTGNYEANHIQGTNKIINS